MTPAIGEQRRKQQEGQMKLLRQEMRKARDMGIDRGMMEGLLEDVYAEKPGKKEEGAARRPGEEQDAEDDGIG